MPKPRHNVRVTTAAVAKSQEAHELAADIVQDWFETRLTTRDVFTQGSIFQRLTEASFDEVQDAVKADYVRTHGPVTDSDDLVDEMCAQEAGYLIGVQVGVRLRAGGGR